MAEKICKLVKKGLHTKDMEKLTSLAGKGRYRCVNCEHTAAKKENLCNPKKL